MAESKHINPAQSAAKASSSEPLTVGHLTTPPLDLLERFTAADAVRIELVRSEGDIRLWRSSTVRTLDDGTKLAQVKFHVSDECGCFAFFVADLDEATAHFEHGVANQFVQSAEDPRFFL